jgi:hypothetical protein
MKKIKLKIIIITIITLFLVVLIGNFTPLKYYLGEPIIHVYHYTNEDGSFNETEIPEKGCDLATVMKLFKDYCYKTGKNNDTLYRVTSRNPFKFWRWFDYLSHPRWDITYKKIAKL